MNIKKTIALLQRKYGTSNPFVISANLGILVLKEDLGTINGYYNKQLRMKQIHINQNLPEHLQMFTCAHELGHALLHPNANTPFLKNCTCLSVDKMEIEANRLALHLLISDEFLKENHRFTTDQLARLLGYHTKLIELRTNDYLNTYK